MERFDSLELVKRRACDEAFGSDVKRNKAGLVSQGQVAGHSDQNEGDSHQRTVGIEGPADDGNEQEYNNDARAWPELQWFVLGSLPMKKSRPISRGERARRGRG